MATYNDIYNSLVGSAFLELRNRIWVAALVKAKNVILGTNAPAERLAWAYNCIQNTESETEILLRYLIASNVTMSIATLSAVGDADVQTAVNSAIDVFYPAP